MAQKTEKQPVLKTPFGVCSYPHLDEAHAAEEGKDPKYSLIIAFTPAVLKKHDGKKLLNALKLAALNTLRGVYGDKADQMVDDGKLKWPFRAMDDEDEDSSHNFPAGTEWIQPSSKGRPGCVDRYADKDGNPVAIALDDLEETIYPGCLVRASVRPYTYSVKGNKGVAFALNNVQKVGEGERIDGRKAAGEEFEAIEDAAEMEDEDEDTPKPKAKKSVAKKRIVADDEEDDEAPAPKAKKRAVVEEEDDDEEPAPKAKRRAIVEDDDEDDDEPVKRKSGSKKLRDVV